MSGRYIATSAAASGLYRARYVDAAGIENEIIRGRYVAVDGSDVIVWEGAGSGDDGGSGGTQDDPVFEVNFTTVNIDVSGSIIIPLVASSDVASTITFSINNEPSWTGGGDMAIINAVPASFTADLSIDPNSVAGNIGSFSISIRATDDLGNYTDGVTFLVVVSSGGIPISATKRPGRAFNDNIDYNSQTRTNIAFMDYIFSEFKGFNKNMIRISAFNTGNFSWLDGLIDRVNQEGFGTLLRIAISYTSTKAQLQALATALINRYGTNDIIYTTPNEPSTNVANLGTALQACQWIYEALTAVSDNANVMPWSGIGSLQPFDQQMLGVRGITRYASQMVSNHDYEGSFRIRTAAGADPGVYNNAGWVGKWPEIMDDAVTAGFPRKWMYCDEWGSAYDRIPGTYTLIDGYEWKAYAHMMGYFVFAYYGYYDHCEYSYTLSFNAGKGPSTNLVITTLSPLTYTPEEPVYTAVRTWNRADVYHISLFRGDFETVGGNVCGQATVIGSGKVRPWCVMVDLRGPAQSSGDPFVEQKSFIFKDDGVNAHGGTGYLEVTGGRKVTCCRLVTGLIHGRTYTVRCWAKCSGAATATLACRGYDADHGNFEQIDQSTSTSWVQLTCQFIPNYNNYVVIALERRDTAGGTVYFDDVEIF